MKDMNQKQYLPEIPADNDLETILSDAVWAAHSLFRRGKTSGSSANLSVIHNGVIYISASGTCFGTLTTSDFAAVAPTILSSVLSSSTGASGFFIAIIC